MNTIFSDQSCINEVVLVSKRLDFCSRFMVQTSSRSLTIHVKQSKTQFEPQVLLERFNHVFSLLLF